MTDLVKEFIHQYRQMHQDKILIVSVNGKWESSYSDSDLYPVLGPANRPQDDAEQNNGIFLQIPDEHQVTKPIIHLSLLTNEANSQTHQQNYIYLGKNSQLHLIEEQFDLEQNTYINNTASTIVVNQDASLIHLKRQHHASKATRIADTNVLQMKNSKTDFTHISDGGYSTQENLKINLQEEGAVCDTAGFYYLQKDTSHIAHHIDIAHNASSTESKMLYKGILKNKSQATFYGCVDVPKDVKKICAYQANHHLLLSKQAEVYAKPILQIDSEDVKCKHGATVGQLDEEALFYLCSRGITKNEALAMLLSGFAQEVIDRITISPIQQQVKNGLS